MSKSLDYLEVSLESLLIDIDLKKVEEKMTSVPGSEKMPYDSWNEASELMGLALDKWLARDVQEFTNVQVEQEFNDGKARLDIVAELRGTVSPFSKYPGKKVIIDWKTSFQPVDGEAFRDKCIRSWQWREYKTLVPEAVLFLYRGLSRDYSYRINQGNSAPAEKVREIALVLNDTHPLEVEQQTNNIYLMRNILGASENNYPWPRNFQSCNDFSVDCPFLKDCENNIYPKSPDLTQFPKMSYSKKELFLRCPERYRRTVIAQMEDTLEKDYDSTTFGSVVHEGLAEIYRQVFKV